MGDPILDVRGLHKRYGAVHATQDLSIDVREGEVHALIGPNGAGKTTLMKLLSGQIQPDGGRIFLRGMDITRLPMHRRTLLGMGRSFQITQVFDHLSVEDNLALAVQAHTGHSFRFWRNVRRDPGLMASTRAALERCGLEERAEESAGSLSHGEKRQLDMGMALAGNPTLLLMDEPMAGMGPGGTVKMTELIMELKGSVSLLLVEHDMDAVFALADRITVLVYGEAIATGTPDEIRRHGGVEEAYLGQETCHVAT
jgi:branched-chain amino acid transport system ATP-binding protein